MYFLAKLIVQPTHSCRQKQQMTTMIVIYTYNLSSFFFFSCLCVFISSYYPIPFHSYFLLLPILSLSLAVFLSRRRGFFGFRMSSSLDGLRVLLGSCEGVCYRHQTWRERQKGAPQSLLLLPPRLSLNSTEKYDGRSPYFSFLLLLLLDLFFCCCFFHSVRPFFFYFSGFVSLHKTIKGFATGCRTFYLGRMY